MSFRPGFLLVVLLTLLAAAGRAAAGEHRLAERPDIVLVVWNDGDLEHLGFLGQGTSPNLDALVRAGTLFSAATLTQGRGRPTAAAILTGRTTHQSGAHAVGGSKELVPEGTLGRVLSDAGYATLYVGKFREGKPADFGFARVADKPITKDTGEVAQFLAENAGKKPLFVYWAPEVRAAGIASAPYTELDPALGRLLAALDAAGRRANTLLCFVTNGEPRKKEFSARECTAEWMRNPLALVLPGQIPVATRGELVTPLDVLPTLLDYAGVAAPAGLAGRSLRPLLAGETPAARTLFGAFYEHTGTNIERDLRALTAREGDWKYTLFLEDVGVKTNPRTELVEIERSAGDQELHDLATDPGEENNLFESSEQAERLARMRAEVLAWWRTSGGPDIPVPFLPPALGAPPPPGKHPNVVLVVADDMDNELLGFQGNPRVHTPTIDGLARAGFVFPVAHVPMSRCRPSLAALLSGRWPTQTGIYDNESKRTLSRRDSLPNLLKAAGYATFLGGKFWEGSQLSMGFLEPKVTDTVFKNFVREDQDELFAFIDRYHESRPLFLWWAPMLPHGPFNPPERFVERFKDVEVPVPSWASGDAKAYQEAERTAYAMGAWFDEGLGALRDKLASVGELEDTLFVFLIDNGYVNGLPSKGSTFEKGLRTPVFFSWQKGIKPGRAEKELVSSLDLYRTILDYAGVPCPPAAAGIDLRPVIEGKQQGVRDVLHGALYAYHERAVRERPEDLVYALYARTGRWKFVLYVRDVTPDSVFLYHEFAPFPERVQGERDLYDLEQDPNELADLSGDPAHAELLDELQRGCLAWWRETGGRELDLGARPGDIPVRKKGNKKK